MPIIHYITVHRVLVRGAHREDRGYGRWLYAVVCRVTAERVRQRKDPESVYTTVSVYTYIYLT